MTRRSLCALTTALGYVLTVAVSASAECAWVLWAELPVASGGWSLDTGREMAFPTKAACEKRLRARIQAFAHATTGEKPFLACLPGTVDPRGPKVKWATLTLDCGFRRLTVTVSAVLFCAGLGITAYDSYVTARYVAALRRMTERFRETETWRPTEEYLLMTDETYKLVLFRSVWGVLLSAGLAAVPWGCFGLARWIVRDFQSPVR